MSDSKFEEAVLRIRAARTADLGRLHPWLDAQTGYLPNAVRHGMAVALEEAVLNVVTHGLPRGAPGEIVVRLRTSHDGAALVVEDPGRPFDPTAVPPPVRPANLLEAEPGGLGLTLLRHFCQDVSYERTGRHNRLTMRFPLNRP